MTFRMPAIQASQYLRLRGTNLPVSTPFETDPAGNPVKDFDAVSKIPCAEVGCPSHLPVVAGVRYSSLDVAAWADLWFYSNPIFIEVTGAVQVAGVK
jgi:hypothetical protein